MIDNEARLLDVVSDLRIVDTHEHLCSEEEWLAGPADVLRLLFGHDSSVGERPREPGAMFSYVSQDLVAAGADPADVGALGYPEWGSVKERFSRVEAAWQAVRTTGYGRATEMTARTVFCVGAMTGPELAAAQEQVPDLLRPGRHLELLRDTARLAEVQIDPGDWRTPRNAQCDEFYRYDINVGAFCSGDIAGQELRATTGVAVRDLDGLREAIGALFARRAPDAVAVKSHHAYVRSLAWSARDKSSAQAALTRVLAGRASEQDTICLGDWCLSEAAVLCAHHGLPLKLHTGYLWRSGDLPLDRVRPALLADLIKAHPRTVFVLMHAGFPYGHELIALAKNLPNVVVDLCWAWALSPMGTERFVGDFLDAAPASKLLAFGGDACQPQEVVGYAAQARRGLSRALGVLVDADRLTLREAERIAERVLSGNQRAVFPAPARALA